MQITLTLYYPIFFCADSFFNLLTDEPRSLNQRKDVIAVVIVREGNAGKRARDEFNEKLDPMISAIIRETRKLNARYERLFRLRFVRIKTAT